MLLFKIRIGFCCWSCGAEMREGHTLHIKYNFFNVLSAALVKCDLLSKVPELEA